MWSYASSHFAKKCTLLNVVNSWHAEYFSRFCHLPIYFKINFFEKNFQQYHQSVKQLDPDQARRFVGPYLRPNYLQRLSADDIGWKC